MSLEGKVAVVTGASRGIGADIARLLAAAGAAVVITARTARPGTSRLAGSLDETLADIERTGGRAIAVPADLSDPADREQIVQRAHDAFGPPDILINNAAVSFFAPVHELPDTRWRLMWEVQVHAAVHLTQLVLPSLLERSRAAQYASPKTPLGSVLCISSYASRLPKVRQRPMTTYDTAYGMTKVALERFTSGLAAELVGTGITANTLKPSGVVKTPGVMHFAHLTPNLERDSEPPWMMSHAALALVSGQPQLINGEVVCSQELVERLSLSQGDVLR